MPIQLSERAHQFPASPIRKLYPLAEVARARGAQVYHLNIGQPDLETPAAYIEVLHKFDRPNVAYSPSQGEKVYIDALVDYYAGIGYSLPPAQFQVTIGGSEAILFTFLAVASPGDEVLIPEPFYTNYLTLAMAAGLQVVPITTRPEDNYRLPPASEIEKLVTKRTRAILVCNPCNPTGTVLTQGELQTLAGLARERNLFLVSDEVYREFVYGEEKAVSALSLAGLEDRVIVVDSISKRYSACGARIGCMVSRNAEIMDCALRLAQARLSAPTLGQLGAAAMRDIGMGYFEATVEEYRKRRDIVHHELSSIPGVLTHLPAGAFYTMARLPVPDAEAFARWLLTDFTLDGHTVMFAPAAGFYATPGLGLDEIRIAYVLKEADLRGSMACLRRGLEVYRA
ncbi:MAG: pyridoxal phosphate-dependent aminotransferase [Candidatus Wallbacteria bacterium]|nr:pyridoxal phosphate-dependent aminotransferase [Candidatus Wallbacteria bacterium]